jgi:hypothetical protein
MRSILFGMRAVRIVAMAVGAIVALYLLAIAFLPQWMIVGFHFRRPWHSASMNSNPPILKIAVMTNGSITADGSPATMESLRASLKRLAEQKGVVWYYREAGQSEVPPQSAEVIQAVIENRLPIRLSSRPDYSDAIGMDGRPVTK